MTQEAYGEAFAAALKRMRVERGLTQAQMAEAVGVTEQSIRNWEGGRSLPNAYYHARLKTWLRQNPPRPVDGRAGGEVAK